MIMGHDFIPRLFQLFVEYAAATSEQLPSGSLWCLNTYPALQMPPVVPPPLVWHILFNLQTRDNESDWVLSPCR